MFTFKIVKSAPNLNKRSDVLSIDRHRAPQNKVRLNRFSKTETFIRNWASPKSNDFPTGEFSFSDFLDRATFRVEHLKIN
jgi:hypothetical protein